MQLRLADWRTSTKSRERKKIEEKKRIGRKSLLIGGGFPIFALFAAEKYFSL